MHYTIHIPDEIWQALKLPEKEKEQQLLKELAINLYHRNILSFGKARELAGLSKWEFHELLGERKIERHYHEIDLNKDFDYASE